RVLGAEGQAHSHAQSLDLHTQPVSVVCRLDYLEHHGGENASARLSVHGQSAVLARRLASVVGGHLTYFLWLHGSGVRRSALDGALHSVAVAALPLDGRCTAKYRHVLLDHVDSGFAVWFGRGQLLVEYGQHQLLLSQERKGHR